MARAATGAANTATGDAALIAQCLEGDQEAWSTLVERYERLVYSIALRAGLGHDDADDVFQVVFTTLFRRLEGLRDQERIASWLITTTSREAWRTGKRQAQRDDLDEELPDPATTPAELAEAADRDQRVRQALARLDERCRGLLTALFLNGDAPDYATISQQLGMPIGSIGPTRARCFKKLEAVLIEEGLR